MSAIKRLLQGLVQCPGTRRRGAIPIPGPDRLWPAYLLMSLGISICCIQREARGPGSLCVPANLEDCKRRQALARVAGGVEGLLGGI